MRRVGGYADFSADYRRIMSLKKNDKIECAESAEGGSVYEGETPPQTTHSAYPSADSHIREKTLSIYIISIYIIYLRAFRMRRGNPSNPPTQRKFLGAFGGSERGMTGQSTAAAERSSMNRQPMAPNPHATSAAGHGARAAHHTPPASCRLWSKCAAPHALPIQRSTKTRARSAR